MADDTLSRFDPRSTYNVVARDYDETSLDFWRYSVPATVRRLELRPGESVLDVACGPGPAALAAAAIVGPTGRVVGLDVSTAMLARAQQHARAADAVQVEFVEGSLDNRPVHPDQFDAVTCVFGMFFARDIAATLATLASNLAAGGRMAVTTLGQQFFSPLYERFVELAATELPGLETNVPWARTATVEQVTELFAEAGLQADVELEVTRLPLRRPDDWWRIVMGTGIRRMAMELSADQLARVRDGCERWAADRQVNAVDLGVIYALAKR